MFPHPCTVRLVHREKLHYEPSALRRWVVAAATFLAFATSVSGCATTQQSVSQSERQRVSSATSFVLLADINDRVFGTRAEGIMQSMTPIYDTDWQTNQSVAAAATNAIEAGGRRVEILRAADITLPQGVKPSSTDAELAALSQAISDKSSAEVQLLIRSLPLDRYGRPRRPGAYFITSGFLGLLSHGMEEFRPTYVVRVNNFIEAPQYGKVECLMSYSLVAIEAKTHKILASLDEHMMHSKLPDDYWISNYESLTDKDKNVLKNVCIDGLVSSVRNDLEAWGLAAPPAT